MVALKNARTRFRLHLVWMLTRHPKFRPLHPADVVSHDAMEQAVYLAGAGYYVPAAMLARATLESRTRRLALLGPNWRECRKGPHDRFLKFLLEQSAISLNQRNRFQRLYSQLSGVVHGEVRSREHCLKLLHKANMAAGELRELSQDLLNGVCYPNDVEPVSGIVDGRL